MFVLNSQKSIFGKIASLPQVNLFGDTILGGVLVGETPINGVGVGEVVVDSELIIVFVNGPGKGDSLTRGSIPRSTAEASGSGHREK